MTVATNHRVEIYALKCPTTGDIRYIGKANDSQKRLKTHVRDSRRRNTPVYCWIKKLTATGLMPVVEVLLVTDADNWKLEEIRLIAEYKAKNAQLLNVAIGGDEPYCSTEQRAKNGRAVFQSIYSNPDAKRLWKAKKQLGDSLAYFKKNGLVEAHNNLLRKIKAIAIDRPKILGKWLLIEEI